MCIFFGSLLWNTPGKHVMSYISFIPDRYKSLRVQGELMELISLDAKLNRILHLLHQ
jgi:hypothetical protein